MSFAEIQDAVAKLSSDERRALLAWLVSENESEINAKDERELLRSLDEAVLAIDSGRGIPMDDVGKRIG